MGGAGRTFYAEFVTDIKASSVLGPRLIELALYAPQWMRVVIHVSRRFSIPRRAVFSVVLPRLVVHEDVPGDQCGEENRFQERDREDHHADADDDRDP